MKNSQNSLKNLQNLGPKIIENLSKIGVETHSDLKKFGPVKIYKELTSKYPNQTWPVCYYLYSIEGALTGKHWDDIGQSKKDELLRKVGKK